MVEWGAPESDGGAPLEGYKVAVRDAKRHMWMEVGRVKADVQKLKVQELAVSNLIADTTYELTLYCLRIWNIRGSFWLLMWFLFHILTRSIEMRMRNDISGSFTTAINVLNTHHLICLEAEFVILRLTLYNKLYI